MSYVHLYQQQMALKSTSLWHITARRLGTGSQNQTTSLEQKTIRLKPRFTSMCTTSTHHCGYKSPSRSTQNWTCSNSSLLSQRKSIDLDVYQECKFWIYLSIRCFVLLLLVAAVMWKIKVKYDLFRRRQVFCSFCVVVSFFQLVFCFSECLWKWSRWRVVHLLKCWSRWKTNRPRNNRLPPSDAAKRLLF